jgi:two-component system, response regulator PdtaR
MLPPETTKTQTEIRLGIDPSFATQSRDKRTWAGRGRRGGRAIADEQLFADRPHYHSLSDPALAWSSSLASASRRAGSEFQGRAPFFGFGRNETKGVAFKIKALIKDRKMMAHDACRRPIVLVVEDEVLIRLQATDIIQDAGFDVLEAANADEAIQILQSRADIEVIFTDVQMPGSMDGIKLAAAVRDRWPPVKIIATSGRSGDFAKNLPSGGRFISKPYGQDVGRIIHEMMAESR